MGLSTVAVIDGRAHIVPEAAGPRRLMWAFRTSRAHVDRTIGAIVELPRGEAVQDWKPQDALAIRRFVNLDEADHTVARGKFVLFVDGIRPTAAVFQCNGNEACRVDCGNAATAVAAALNAKHGLSKFSYDLTASNGSNINVDAVVHQDGVDQVWGIRQELALRRLEVGGTVIAEVDFLNLYYIIPASFPIESLDPVAVAAPTLRRRVAVIDLSTDPPTARFRTCGRVHPSAPLTGLTILAMAAETVEWLAPLRRRPTLLINGIPEALPAVEGSGGAWKINLPRTECRLRIIGGVQN